MSLKISSNTAEEAAVPANQLKQGEIGKVVSVSNNPNVFPTAVNCFLIRGSVYDAEGAMAFIGGLPKFIRADHLYHYNVVRVPQGFVLKVEVA